MKALRVSHQELNGAIESYHLKLKSKLLSNSHASSWDRVDWLVHTLSAEFHSMYWFYKYSEECGIFRSYIEEFFPRNPWHRALHIPDLDVILDEEDLNFAKVVSQSDRSQAYTVWNPGSEFSICDCPWSRAGNLCKHVIKVNILCRNRQLERPSLASEKYRQTLTNLLQNPPDDPLVLDHAIARATCLQHDLKGLEDLSNSGLLQPLSTLETSVLFGEGILSQAHMPERNARTKRRRVGTPSLSIGGSQLDFHGQASLLLNPQIPGSNQMGEVLDLFKMGTGSNLLNSINDQVFISSGSIVLSECEISRPSKLTEYIVSIHLNFFLWSAC